MPDRAAGNVLPSIQIENRQISHRMLSLERAFNVFRRFRESVLQRSEARQILIDYWMGHSNPSMGDRYGKQFVEDVKYRQEQVKKVGLGFDLPTSLFGLSGLQNVASIRSEAAA